MTNCDKSSRQLTYLHQTDKSSKITKYYTATNLLAYSERGCGVKIASDMQTLAINFCIKAATSPSNNLRLYWLTS